jgi:enamine deaminase RidA (YjgF/YER057c/UK114 family)
MDNSAKMGKIHTEAFDAVVAESNGVAKFNITANIADDPQDVVEKTLNYLATENAEIISGFAFGNHEILTKLIGEESSHSITILRGDTCRCPKVSAIQLTAISGTDLTPVTIDGDRIGSSFIFDGHRHCVLPGVHAETENQTRGANATAAFEKMLSALQTVGMDFSNVIRMWNYLDDLLSWYDEFNAVRNTFFTQNSVYDAIVPAGTGIGAANQHGTAYIGDAWAIKEASISLPPPACASSKKSTSTSLSTPAPPSSITNNNLSAFAVPSPLQCPAIDYKSSFSRAVEINSENFRTLSISGTASIEPGGKTVFLDDTERQIDKTLQVIAAILESREMKWSDTVRAIAYFANLDDLPLLAKRMKANNIPAIPMAISHAAICRDDLLFEIELDAVRPID